ncbi:Hypothetical protein Ccan_02860 [Capnocytophaga canimorsus Cc5]|uniref:Uncharacterized protein n=2 Tax=Capnocytophaga canimorsus TaxID=28188 RepID=F9YR50_CAPCC|nr:Hypothetical protein Ccan_02860 [Capnocytophaga canimorsus Cc5]
MGIFLITGLNALFWGLYILFVIGLVVYFIISNRVLYQERKSITVLKSIFLIALYFIISLLIAFYIGLISVAYI